MTAAKTAAVASQIQRIDQAMLALLDERARLVATLETDGRATNGSGAVVGVAAGAAVVPGDCSRDNVLRRYSGDYQLRPGSVLTLSSEGGEVSMSGWLLVPTSESTFFSPQDYAEIAVVVGQDGSVERLDWTVAGETYPMPRVEAGGD